MEWIHTNLKHFYVNLPFRLEYQIRKNYKHVSAMFTTYVKDWKNKKVSCHGTVNKDHIVLCNCFIRNSVNITYLPNYIKTGDIEQQTVAQILRDNFRQRVLADQEMSVLP